MSTPSSSVAHNGNGNGNGHRRGVSVTTRIRRRSLNLHQFAEELAQKAASLRSQAMLLEHEALVLLEAAETIDNNIGGDR